VKCEPEIFQLERERRRPILVDRPGLVAAADLAQRLRGGAEVLALAAAVVQSALVCKRPFPVADEVGDEAGKKFATLLAANQAALKTYASPGSL
jgi:hypothetical protein